MFHAMCGVRQINSSLTDCEWNNDDLMMLLTPLMMTKVVVVRLVMRAVHVLLSDGN